MTGPDNTSPEGPGNGDQASASQVPYGQAHYGQQPYGQYGQPQWSSAGPPPPPQTKNRKPLYALLALVAVAAVIGVIIGAVGGSEDETEPKVADPALATTYSLSPAEKQANEEAAAEAQRKAAEAQAAEEAAAREKVRAQKDPATYEQITERDWQLLVKDPDANAGRKIVLYGSVTQFDSGTGTSIFRADTAGEPMDRSYEYDVNTIVSEGTPGVFDQVVKGDLVTLYVEIEGSHSYDTTIGGSTTAPIVNAFILEVTGSD